MKRTPLILLTLLSTTTYADISKNTKAEINHLITFVKTSTCLINRNGDEHNGNDAIEHIQKKYDYYKDEINSAEQFIEYSATKSTMSGNFYKVKCGDAQPIKTQLWLLDELKTYRNNH